VKKATAPKSAVKKAPSSKAAKAAPVKSAPAKKAAVKATKPAAKVVAKPAATPAAKAAPKRAAPAAKRPAGVKSTAGTVVESIEPYREAPGEDYMNDTQREHFRNILLAWKRELMEEVDRTVHHMQDEAANFPDPNDRATQESEFSMELRARDRERKLIKKIDETLGKLDHEEYGYCDACGVEIGIRRLEARPTAALCIDCKTLDEIREKQMGS
ncbi:MAG: RNA polymerase-binding protein DksA, partial [Thiohalobacteraceae bacterium]